MKKGKKYFSEFCTDPYLYCQVFLVILNSDLTTKHYQWVLF